MSYIRLPLIDMFSLVQQTKQVEKLLCENGNRHETDPTRQYDWNAFGVHETEHLPHQLAMSMHEVPNVQCLLRSEMMIVVGLILARLRRKRFPKHDIFPVSRVVISLLSSSV